MRKVKFVSFALVALLLTMVQNVKGSDAVGSAGSEALSGVFSVSPTETVRFSRGNLQYVQSSDTWQFAEHQYDMLGESNVVGEELADKIDLFGWSAKGAKVQWGISTSVDKEDYARTSDEFVDWGLNIGDGKTWRTLTDDELWHLMGRKKDGKPLCGVAQLLLGAGKTVNGLILLPDDWKAPAGITFEPRTAEKDTKEDYRYVQVISKAAWEKMEAAGAVFFPASGERYGAHVSMVQEKGYYWTAVPAPTDHQYALMYYFGAASIVSRDRDNLRGCAVRLVTHCGTKEKPIEGIDTQKEVVEYYYWRIDNSID